MGFWNFPTSSKIDILHEGSHTDLICQALTDKETHIYQAGDKFIIYGEEEGLVIKPSSLSFELWLLVFVAYLRILDSLCEG